VTAGPSAPQFLTYSAVVPTKDRPEAATETVANLLEQTRPPARIVVVDASGRPFEPPEAVRARAHGLAVDLRVEQSRPSVHAQRNLGARQIDTPIVLFLDDDVRIPPNYVQALLERWEERGLEALGAIAGTPAVVPRQGALERFVRRVTMLSVVDPRRDAMTLRRSGKVRFVPEPRGDVHVPVLASGATAYRTDLVLRHPFDERFPGYTPGGDLEMAARVATEAPLVQTPAVRWTHLWDPRERVSPSRWYVRGRCETYFRLRRLDRRPLTVAAFGVALLADGGLALADSLRERRLAHVRGFVSGVVETLRSPPPPFGRPSEDVDGRADVDEAVDAIGLAGR
jgi:glycosyltransferase involved in cell wall biosynthesis